MSEFVVDTHALHWHLTNDTRLSQTAQELLNQADLGQHRIFVPSIILVEVVYLVEKGRLDATLFQQLLSLFEIEGGI